jgi:hypothetical protein
MKYKRGRIRAAVKKYVKNQIETSQFDVPWSLSIIKTEKEKDWM